MLDVSGCVSDPICDPVIWAYIDLHWIDLVHLLDQTGQSTTMNVDVFEACGNGFEGNEVNKLTVTLCGLLNPSQRSAVLVRSCMMRSKKCIGDHAGSASNCCCCCQGSVMIMWRRMWFWKADNPGCLIDMHLSIFQGGCCPVLIKFPDFFRWLSGLCDTMFTVSSTLI